MSQKIDMDKYALSIYCERSNITQGCIIFITSTLEIIDKQAVAILIIENACNLVEEGDRKPKTDRLEYILIFSATKTMIETKYLLPLSDLIQNRRFQTDLAYLPPKKGEAKFPDGLVADCTKCGFINLEKLKQNTHPPYLCIQPPFRDYIKNKTIQFKLAIPLSTITDEEVQAWIIHRFFGTEGKTIDNLMTLRPPKLTVIKFNELITNLVKKQYLELKENKYYWKQREQV